MGTIGTYWSRIPHTQFFIVVAAIAAGAAVLLLLVKGRLQAALEPAEEGRRTAA